MKIFNKSQSDEFDVGVGSIIKDETAEIISKFGSTKNDYDDLTIQPVTPPKAPAEPPIVEQKMAPSAPPVQPTRTATRKPAATIPPLVFGIKDAISLIDSLPPGNPEIIIPVVIKTLESANIHLEDIIEDADKQERILETRSMRLISKIEILEAQVAAMNDRVLTLNESIEEISNIKQMFLPSFTIEEEVLIEEEYVEEELIEEEPVENTYIEEIRSTHTNISQEDVDSLADEIRNDLNGEFDSGPH